MSMLVAAIVFVPLLAVAIAHFIWSLGGTWPLRNKELLVKTVYGRPATMKMPPRLLTFAVALLVLGAGIVALALADPEGGGPGLTLIGLLLALLFLARGIAGYTARWRQVFSEEPFATLDRRTYSPLALILGAGYLILVVMRLL
jgi:peptidoglycan/LPS O-acetylase OafA/YrhL